ncbi:RNA polymerase-associated protein [Sporobolomyces salmoneus]|uniref:RNA polymerase-associated protein n=1 Tax=Sporobolomyces salmoneus TaxID=183962 RepID=UPI00316BAF56
MDIDDELLGLAEGGASKRKSKSSGKKSNKRRRPAESGDGSASDMDMSASDSDAAPAATTASRGRKVIKSAEQIEDSDEEAGGAGGEDEDPYPLEGIYKNAADRKHIKSLPEFEREHIIAERKEEMHERETRIQVAKMASRSRGPKRGEDSDAEGEDDDEDDEDYGSSRATRQRKATGLTSSKNEGLEKLKRSRAEKGKKKEKKKEDSDSDDDYEAEGKGKKSKSRKRKDSYETESDPELSDAEEEEVQKKSKSKKKEGPQITLADLQAVTVPRAKLAEFYKAPWFEEWAKGAWVRLGVGIDSRKNTMAYRICQIEGIRTGRAKPYKVEATSTAMTDIELTLRHGKSVRNFTMEIVSNSPVAPEELNRLKATCLEEKVDMPTPKELNKVKEQLAKHKEYIMTEQDLAAQLAKNGRRPVGAAAKARLLVQRDHAHSTGDTETYEKTVKELAELEAGTPTKENEQERMRRVNERNRASNREEIQKAEARSQEERRRQAASLAKGENVKVDPSARVKTMTRLTYDSRGGTPGTPTGATTPTKNGASTPSLAASAARTKGNKIESVVASSVQLDLDLDF